MSSLATRIEGLRSNRKSNLARTAYDQIKEAIIYAKFKPGDSLSENMMAKVLGMSRTPVREALKELAREDLVEILPGRGVYVKDISLKELKDLYELRGVLECLAAETAVHNTGSQELSEMEEEWLAVLGHYRQGQVDWETISNLDNKFHRMIINKSDNNQLREFMGLANQKILRFQLLSARALGDVEDTVRQHLEIIDLLKIKDRGKLIQVLAGHIEMAARNIIMTEIRDRL
jgi:DNA-binding GntR family transcriptional regulator